MERIMRSQMLIVPALMCALVQSANYSDASGQEAEARAKFTKQVEVFGVIR